MNDYKFGNFIYLLRKEKGMSQTELGELLGVSNKAVSKWENGAAKPRGDILLRLADALSVTVDELLEGARKCEETPALSNIEKEEYKHLRKCTVIAFSVAAGCAVSLFAFIGVVVGFNLPDDILGPVGSVILILTCILALTVGCVFASQALRKDNSK